MTSARDRSVAGLSTPLETRQPLASWYAPGVSDGLGDRLLMFDNTQAPSWELLRFRPEFVAVPGFESALRGRVGQLAQFRHHSFPTVRSVEDLGARNGLALVSTYVAGRRLWEVLERPRSAAAARRLIRQLTPALAALQQQGDALAHGVLTTDRIVLTTDGRFMIREHVLGSALQRLQLSATRLWVDLGIVARSTGDPVPRLDPRTDVIQLGLIALALMLGRRIDTGEYPGKVGDLLDHLARTSSRRSPFVFPPLRHWLEQALQLKDRPFGCAQEANDALGEWSDEPYGDEADFELPASHEQDGVALQRASAPEPPPSHLADARVNPLASAPAVDLERDGSSDLEGDGSSRRGKPDRADRSAPVASVQSSAGQPRVLPVDGGAREEGPVGRRRKSGTDRPHFNRLLEPVDQAEQLSEVFPDVPPGVLDRSRPLRWAAAGAVVVALGEAALITYLTVFRSPAPPPAATAILVESLLPGAGVLVDGRPAGITPLRLNVDSRTLSIRVQNPEASPRVGATNPLPPTNEVQRPPRTRPSTGAVDGPRSAAAPQRSGSVRLSSTIELLVFEGERLLGSSRDGPIEATVGRHAFDLVNSELGYRSRREVDIKAAQILTLEVTPANGSVSINASPWAEVWIDGNAVGETPLAKLSVPLGEHEFIFRHPQLGERRQRAKVRSEGVTLVSARLQP
jgi:hypothetical protein